MDRKYSDGAAIARPIETAPRDKTIFVAFDDLGYPYLAWGDEDGFYNSAYAGDRLENLVWWGPLPLLP